MGIDPRQVRIVRAVLDAANAAMGGRSPAGADLAERLGAIQAHVLRIVPDCDDKEFAEAAKIVATAFEMQAHERMIAAALLEKVRAIAAAHRTKPGKTIAEAFQRALDEGDQEAMALLPRLRAARWPSEGGDERTLLSVIEHGSAPVGRA